MAGIVIGVLGVMQALMLPLPALPDWTVAVLGGAIVVVGLLVTVRAASQVDRSVPANERRLPSARVHRSPRR